jgi:hypothetical protein
VCDKSPKGGKSMPGKELTNNAGSVFDFSITTFTKTFALLLFITLLMFLGKIYCLEEQREQVNNALQLNGDIYSDYDPKLLAAFV